MSESSLNPSETYVVARRAYEYALHGSYDSAAILLEGLLALDPNDRYAAVTLAAVRLKQNRPGDAATLLEAVRRRDARDEEATGLLAEARLAVGRVADTERLVEEMHAVGTEVPERLRLRLEAAKSGVGARRLNA